MASVQVQVGKQRPKGKQGCSNDPLEDPRPLGLQDQCDETQGLSWEGP